MKDSQSHVWGTARALPEFTDLVPARSPLPFTPHAAEPDLLHTHKSYTLGALCAAKFVRKWMFPSITASTDFVVVVVIVIVIVVGSDWMSKKPIMSTTTSQTVAASLLRNQNRGLQRNLWVK